MMASKMKSVVGGPKRRQTETITSREHGKVAVSEPDGGTETNVTDAPT
jgi:hypothetical protein